MQLVLLLDAPLFFSCNLFYHDKSYALSHFYSETWLSMKDSSFLNKPLLGLCLEWDQLQSNVLNKCPRINGPALSN